MMAEVYIIKRNDKVGRYAVAGRELRAGDELIVEWPMVIGPKTSSKPVCLGCYCPWPIDGPVCEACRWPVCGPQCANQPLHREAECTVFAAAKVRFNIKTEQNSADAPSPQYECITPLRLLLAKEHHSSRWDAEVVDLEAHTEYRKSQPNWAIEHVNVVEFLRRKCKLADRFSEDLIHWVIGVLEVNTFEVRTEYGYFIRGLYPLTAIMSHSCVANTTHTIYPAENFRIQARTTITVPEGEELFTSYTSSIQPTLFRRENIKYSKFFDCDCERCADPTELGTHLSSLKCTECDDGIITSSNSLDNEACWICSHCKFIIRSEIVRKKFMQIQDKMEQMENMKCFDSKIKEAEKLLKMFKNVLHQRHAYLTLLRHSLLELYGRAPGYKLSDLPDIVLERKVELCHQVLEVIDVIVPGKNRFRGLILHELHAPLFVLSRNRYKYSGLISKEEFKIQMEQVTKLLREAIDILCVEDPNSHEGKISLACKNALNQLMSIDLRYICS